MAPPDDRGQTTRTQSERSVELSSVRCRLTMVGLGRFELPTSRLSSARSNQLSYKPETLKVLRTGRLFGRALDKRMRADARHGLVHEEREMKTAASRRCRMTDNRPRTTNVISVCAACRRMFLSQM